MRGGAGTVHTRRQNFNHPQVGEILKMDHFCIYSIWIKSMRARLKKNYQVEKANMLQLKSLYCKEKVIPDFLE